VRIFYEGEDGQRFQDTQRLDLDLYAGLRPVHRDTIHQVSETLKKMERHLDRWSAGFEGGLLVLSPEDQRRRAEEFRAWVKEQQVAEQAEAEGQPDEVQQRHEDIEAGLAEQSEPHSQPPGTAGRG
jgi:hypothetical protein